MPEPAPTSLTAAAINSTRSSANLLAVLRRAAVAAPGGGGGGDADSIALWARSPACEETATSLLALARLEEARAAIFTGQVRARAARTLLRIARKGGAHETQRKACVDLLRAPAIALSAHARPAPDAAPTDTPDHAHPADGLSLSPADERDLRALLADTGDTHAD